MGCWKKTPDNLQGDKTKPSNAEINIRAITHVYIYNIIWVAVPSFCSAELQQYRGCGSDMILFHFKHRPAYFCCSTLGLHFRNALVLAKTSTFIVLPCVSV